MFVTNALNTYTTNLINMATPEQLHCSPEPFLGDYYALQAAVKDKYPHAVWQSRTPYNYFCKVQDATLGFATTTGRVVVQGKDCEALRFFKRLAEKKPAAVQHTAFSCSDAQESSPSLEELLKKVLCGLWALQEEVGHLRESVQAQKKPELKWH